MDLDEVLMLTAVFISARKEAYSLLRLYTRPFEPLVGS